ncbi:FHF complex subunit HOOK-interacting protein 2B isoform X1 [Paramormyrops kingsleyae]|uniref:FHF complex subunit HOOK interacting protein 2B n=2 Tax=Paramormyrops kingsleyae TaxID=1676925 RepID=A0A3B3QU46_9TELE|nr:protein FAM160B2 isoform X1 [Paramormyrops kingsleyae]
MDMFNKLTTLFQQALETREPSVNLQDSFVEHWKGITNYYIETTDDLIPVKETDIPWRLKQMLDILVYEEKQQESQETGPCMEYLLQHKILETLCTLGKAEYPPGMIQQVLGFFTKLLTQIQQPLLHIINVYRPVQKLICLCAQTGSQTEKEEAQFLFVICSRLKQDPYVLNYILGIKTEEPSRRSCSSSGDEVQQGDSETPNGEKMPPGHQNDSGYLSSPCRSPSLTPEDKKLIHALLFLTKSQKSRVALRACEGLSLLLAIPKEETAECLGQKTAVCQMVAGRLSELYSSIPLSLEPVDVHSCPDIQWRVQCSPKTSEESSSLPGREQLEAFLAWLDFCNHLVNEAPRTLSIKLAKAIRRQWLVAVVQPQLLQVSEAGMLLHMALLSRILHRVSAPTLLEELVFFILGSQRNCERQVDPDAPVLRRQLIENCNHISDEISIATLRLFEELLQKPHEHVVFNLALRNLERRGYIAPGAAGGGEERQPGDGEPLEESVEFEEDPFFTDMDSEGNFNHVETLVSLPPQQRGQGEPGGQSQAADIVNSFLCLVPQEAKTSRYVQGAGYDTYVHDAHEMFKDCREISLNWGWPTLPQPPEVTSLDSCFYEGHFLKILFDRIAQILEQPYELNLQVTSVLSRLASFPHPHLHEYLLNPYISLATGSRSLFSVLIRVIGDLMQRIQHIPNFTEKLVHVRKQLMSLEPESLMDHVTLLKGVIVLEEFCKELAAIVFVKLPMEDL